MLVAEAVNELPIMLSYKRMISIRNRSLVCLVASGRIQDLVPAISKSARKTSGESVPRNQSPDFLLSQIPCLQSGM